MKNDLLLKMFSIALTIVIFVLIITNCFVNSEFFITSLSQLMTPIIALIFAFWATQFKTDKRKQKTYIETLIEKLQILVTNSNFYNINTATSKEDVLMTNRKISNYIDLLKKCSKTFRFEDEIKYIDEQFQTYKDFVSDNINDFSNLESQQKLLRRLSENIENKCNIILFHLYE